jgi:hypothetical protein
VLFWTAARCYPIQQKLRVVNNSTKGKGFAGLSLSTRTFGDPVEESRVMPHQYEVKTLHHFLRRVAIDYLRYRYFRYALREIPVDKDPLRIDEKILSVYSVTRCRTTRMRQRAKQLANVQYVRWKRSFLLLATEGNHPAFDRIRSYDFRTTPLHFHGYSIGVLQKKPCIMVCRKEWEQVKERFLKIGLHAKSEVERKLNILPYYHFPGVVRQQRALTAALNQRRKQAGLKPITLNYQHSLSPRFPDPSPHIKS